ncbi:hypothetical protein BSLG_006304 [Batrachochytrium salamandrivorans]|nr:hypothetical protein BASA60_008819 [Batrachochytrium salamandrivorans]KAH6578053.1 hypothetical protein BASA62_000492 [Batrachochytrium salamandrivorans]KAH9248375.1 hypothetical protein BASA81_013961 [Batrachochytrium salamandrivorans]KAJ1339166.1 hypothetical protein BSLG_006304 [Batrachochytrium salamandrivorans]
MSKAITQTAQTAGKALGRKLQVYILPTIGGRYVFHSRFVTPKNNFEYAMLFMSFVTRKWRYQVSDFSASYWHNFGQWAIQSKSKASSTVYFAVSKMLSRRASDEYFFKTIPPTIDQVEFIYPPCLNEKLIHEQLQNWLKDSGVHQHRMIIGALLLPANFLLAKVIWLPANIFLVYYLFRVNASIRANSGANMLQKLINSRQVNWIPSPEFQSQIETLSTDVTHRIAKTENMAVDSPTVWKWDPQGDLHDDVIAGLQKQLNVHEWSNTYRRSRMQYYMHPTSK